MGQDNNKLAPEVHQILRFEPGDTIYVSIVLDTPTVSVTNAAQQGAPATSNYDKDISTGIQKEKYDIKIELGPRSAEYDAAPGPAPVITPENPINVSYDGLYIYFDLPNTAQYLDFVDVLIGGNYYRGWADPSSVGDGEFQLDIIDTTVSLELPVLVTGTVQIFTRYDKYTNSAEPGLYELVAAPVITPENPINVTYDGRYIIFDLPNTAQYLDFVDVLIGGNYYRGWADPSSVGVGEFHLGIVGTTVTVQLPVLVTGVVQIITRYDKYTNSSDNGLYELVVAPSFIRYGINQALLTSVDTNRAYGVKVDGVDKHVQINAAAGMEGGVAIIAYTFAELSSSSTISIKHKGTNYNISSTILNTWNDGGSANVTRNYQLTSSSSSLLSITDAGLYLIRIGETNDGNLTPVIALTKINNISLIGDAVGNWETDVQLTRVSEYVYQASNVQFNYGNPFKIRTNNTWPQTTYLDIEADSNNQNRIFINGNMDIPFMGISGAYDVKLYLTDPTNLALELTPYVAPAINPFYTGNEVPFTITNADVPSRHLTVLSNGSYTGDINIHVVQNSNFSGEFGISHFYGGNILNEIGTGIYTVSATIQTGDTLQIYRLYDVDGVTKLTTPVALSNVFTIPAPTIQVVSGTAGGVMTVKFTPNVTSTNVCMSFSSDGSTYMNDYIMNYVTSGIQFIYTTFVEPGTTHVRFVDNVTNTIIAGPVSIVSAPPAPNLILTREQPNNTYPITIDAVNLSNNTITFTSANNYTAEIGDTIYMELTTIVPANGPPVPDIGRFNLKINNIDVTTTIGIGTYTVNPIKSGSLTMSDHITNLVDSDPPPGTQIKFNFIYNNTVIYQIFKQVVSDKYVHIY
jgi:hypothetical protein